MFASMIEILPKKDDPREIVQRYRCSVECTSVMDGYCTKVTPSMITDNQSTEFTVDIYIAGRNEEQVIKLWK